MNDGTTQLLPSDRVARAQEAFDRELAYAEKAEEHLWIAAVAHRVSTAKARVIANGDQSPLLLDGESVASIGVGCYRCEKPLEARLIGKRCRGDG